MVLMVSDSLLTRGMQGIVPIMIVRSSYY